MSTQPSPSPTSISLAPGLTIYLRWRTWWVYSRRLHPPRQSLHTSDQREATKQALEVEHTGYVQPRVEQSTIEEALDRYMLEHAALHQRPNTQKRYRQVIGIFMKQVGPKAPPCAILRKHLLEFQRERAKKLSPDTVNGDVGYLKSFINWCRAEGLIAHDPCFKVRRIKVNRRERQTLTWEQFGEIVVAVEESAFLLDYVTVAANTGMRPNEILHVRGCDLEAERKLLHITAWGDWRTKDSEDRSLELNSDALGVMARRKLANGKDALPLFAGRGGVVRDWKNVSRELKKAIPLGLRKWVGLYEFRHFFATEAVKRKWPTQDLQLYMGHANISTTLNYYTHVRAEQVGAPPVISSGGA